MSDNRKLGEARLSRTDETSVSADRDKVADVELGAEDVAFAFNLPLSSVVGQPSASLVGGRVLGPLQRTAVDGRRRLASTH